MDVRSLLILAQSGISAGGETPDNPDSSPAGLWAQLKSQATPDRLMELAQDYGPRVLSAIAVFIIGRWAARIISRVVVGAARRAKVDDTLLSFLGNLINMLLLTVVCITALGCLGIDTTSVSAVLAAAGFAIGLALQGSLGNLASGVMLVLFKPFQVGDYVDLGSASGTVVQIHIFSTVLLKPDNVRVIVPNGNITSNTIQNYSAESRRRIDLVVGCGYSDDLLAVKQFLTEVLATDSRVLAEPEPTVAVSELADSSVNFVVRPWVDSKDYWPTRFELTERIKLGFDERGFTIPFPSSDVFLHQSDAA